MPFAGRVLAAEDGSPLGFATVHVLRDGIAYGTTADADGLYYMEEAAPGEEAYVRHVGRITEEFTVPREPLQLYTHRLVSSNELGEVEVFGDKPDADGEANEGGNGAPGSNVGVLAALGISLVLLLAAKEDN
jgi:hypothetical protein